MFDQKAGGTAVVDEAPPEEVPYRRRRLPGVDLAAWSLAALALFSGAVFVLVDLSFNQGKLIAPLDDVYIHLQYGSQLGQGHFFQYNTGDPVSTGASSFLYALVLGAAYAVGLQGNLLLPFAVSFGIVCLAGTVVCGYRLARLFVGRAAGIWTGVLVALSGPLLWGATSGMEITLVAQLLVACALAFAMETPRGRFLGTPVLTTLLALARPEGLIFAVALCAAMCWTIATSARHGGRGRALGHAVLSLLPLVAAGGQLLFYKLATGTTAANGIQAKSHFYDQPITYFADVLDRSAANLRGLIDAFAGLNNWEYAFPCAILLAVLGVAYLLGTRPAMRPLLIATTAGFVVALLSISTLNTALIHNLRYVQPLIPLFLLFVVAGVHALASAAPSTRVRQAGFHVVLTTALLFSISVLPTWGVRLGKEAATIRDTDVSVGAWIDGNLPADATVGVKDVGAVKYFGDRYVVDIIGLATNGLAEAANNGIGSTYEALRHLPARQRPDYFALYETQPGPLTADLVTSGVLGDEPLITFKVRAPDSAIVPFRELAVYQADWSLAGTGERSPAGGAVRDYVNVGDLASERAHSYAVEPALVGLQPITSLRRELPEGGRGIVDSGRRVVGGEHFTVGGLTPGEPLTITSRTGATEEDTPEVRVLVDGVAVATWERRSPAAGWAVHTLTVPGELVTGTSVDVALTPERPLLAPYPEYTSYGYWFAQ